MDALGVALLNERRRRRVQAGAHEILKVAMLEVRVVAAPSSSTRDIAASGSRVRAPIDARFYGKRARGCDELFFGGPRAGRVDTSSHSASSLFELCNQVAYSAHLEAINMQVICIQHTWKMARVISSSWALGVVAAPCLVLKEFVADMLKLRC